MILTDTEVLELAKGECDGFLKDNIKLQDTHKVHITGEGVENKIEHLSQYETPAEFAERKQDIKEYTRILTKSLIDAHSRWKSAQGTSKYYKFKANSEVLSKEMEGHLQNVHNGSSIEKFIKDFLSAALFQEFNSFLLVERGAVVKEQDGRYEIAKGIKRKLPEGKDPLPYIVFISVNDVHRVKKSGDIIEYIILNHGEIERGSKKIKLFRVIDDLKDYIVEVDGETATLSKDFAPVEHKAGACPVVQCSTLKKSLAYDYTCTSTIDNLIGPLDKLLSQYIDHTTTARKHNFPIRWQRGSSCTHTDTEYNVKCNGGNIHYKGEDGEYLTKKCPACHGGGVITVSPSTVLLVPFYDTNSNVLNVDEMAGYVTPELENFTQQREDIDWWEAKIREAALGIGLGTQEANIQKTATEAIIGIKPLEDIISAIVDQVEYIETQLTNFIGKIIYGDKYVGCEILRGRKLNLRDESMLLSEIKNAKASGASQVYIKMLSEELLWSRFIRSQSDIARIGILNELEPLPGWTFEEIEKSTSITKETKALKQNFNDIIQEFELQHGPITEYKPNQEARARIKKIKDELLKIAATKLSTDQGGELGKIPLALQQLALAKFRAEQGGDLELAAELGKKMEELTQTI